MSLYLYILISMRFCIFYGGLETLDLAQNNSRSSWFPIANEEALPGTWNRVLKGDQFVNILLPATSSCLHGKTPLQ